MTMERQSGTRVSLFSRCLAWIYVACCAFIVVSLIAKSISRRDWPIDAGTTMLLALAVLVFGPLFLFVAVSGRSPGWLSSVENAYDHEARRRGVRAGEPRKGWKISAVSAALVFGGIEIAMGVRMGILTGENGFAVLVFAVVWAIVAVLIWRYFKPRARDGAGPS
jgi:hypothetical protein